MRLIEAIDLDELGVLARGWGVVRHEHMDVGTAHPFNGSPEENSTRRAEICYVMHEGDPTRGLLLHTKGDYPVGVYRMPTGGVHHGEPIMETLAREIEEETGLIASDDPTTDMQTVAHIQRFLGITSYTIHYRESPNIRTFATYHFLVQKPLGQPLIPQDENEDITGWQWLPKAQLPTLADQLAALQSLGQYWYDWGKFRAISHRFVYRMLDSESYSWPG